MATALSNLSEYDASKVPNCNGAKVALVISEWNEEITSGLAKGAIETLTKHGVDDEDIIVRHVPGAFELPLGAQMVLEKDEELDAVICIGCVIQGQTKHFDFVCQGTTQGIMDVGLNYALPVIFCVLTDNTIEQSRARSGGEHGNKGVEAAVTALKMIHFNH
jgi:6,7-dimethyl-8-ribityllumazine synthase